MHPTPRAHLFIAAAAACALVFAGASLAVPLTQGNGGSPAVPQAVAQRSVVWVGYPNQANPHAIRISSLSVGAPVTDVFQIQYAGGNFTLEYQKNASGPVTNTYALTLRSLVEWDDLNGNGVIDNETILQTFPLGDTAFGAVPIRHSQDAIPGGGAIHFFTIASNSGELVLNLTISERFFRLNAQETLTPMEAKLTIEIAHTLVVPGAHVALDLGVQTSSQPRLEETSWDDEHNFSAGDHQIEMTNESGPGASAVFFAWSTEASVNDRQVPVAVTGPMGEESVSDYYDMYIAYPSEGILPAGSLVHVVHDPMMGVVSAAYASLANVPEQAGLHSDTTLYAVTLAAVAGLVLATVVLARRRRSG